MENIVSQTSSMRRICNGLGGGVSDESPKLGKGTDFKGVSDKKNLDKPALPEDSEKKDVPSLSEQEERDEVNSGKSISENNKQTVTAEHRVRWSI